MVLEYRLEKRKLEAIENVHLTKIHNDHLTRAKTLEQHVKERDQILSIARLIIDEGLRS